MALSDFHEIKKGPFAAKSSFTFTHLRIPDSLLTALSELWNNDPFRFSAAVGIRPHFLRTKKRGYENIIHFWQHDVNSTGIP